MEPIVVQINTIKAKGFPMFFAEQRSTIAFLRAMGARGSSSQIRALVTVIWFMYGENLNEKRK